MATLFFEILIGKKVVDEHYRRGGTPCLYCAAVNTAFYYCIIKKKKKRITNTRFVHNI